jgi:hyperosmotically inducible periplasmic protein
MKYGIGLIFLMLNFVAPILMATTKLHVVEQSLSDSVISTKINAKLAKNGEMNPFKLHVSTKHGVVTLKGSVRDKKMFVDVLRLVKVTKGVRGVKVRHLRIQQVNTPITDAYITAKVEAAVLKAKVFDDESIPLVGINARTVNGTVVLSGFVKRRQSIPYIISRVAKVHGVKKVNSKLKVAIR